MPSENHTVHIEYGSDLINIICGGFLQLYSELKDSNQLVRDKCVSVRHRFDNNRKRAMQDTDVISQVIGNWGRWQLRAVLLIYLCKIPSAWFMACIIFTAPTPRNGEFFCRAPTDIAASFPGANESESLWSVHRASQKQSLEVDFCLEHNDTKAPCQQFEHSSPFNSLVTEFDLVCSKTILIAVTQFFHLFGVLTGGILANKFLEL